MARRGEVLTPDEDLVAACLGGDQSAWNGLVDRYAALIYSVALKYGFGEADAADVFQSVCVTLLEKLSSVREPRGLAAWIITTTSRQCLALARAQSRERERSAVGMVIAESQATDPDRLPEDEVLALERQYQVRTAVTQLPPNCRGLVEALFADTPEPQSYQHLADRLRVPINSVGPMRARCLSRLRHLLLAAGYVP